MESDRTQRHRCDEPLSMLIYNSNVIDEQSTTGLDGRFVQSQLLISCLLKMKTIRSDRHEFICRCREFYKENKKQLEAIDEFEKDYVPQHCLWWYSIDSFLYRILNKALRVQNIDLLFLLRFFIRDIEKQLHRQRCLEPIHVYRGQLMSKWELNALQNSINKLISVNSFLSTSRISDVALMYLQHDAKDSMFERVLLEIDADPNQDGVKPFADISKISRFSQEDEILMMLGSIFRLRNISFDDEKQIWRIQLDLCSDHDCDVKNVVKHMGTQYGLINTKLLWLAYVLIDTSDFDDSEKYLYRVLKDLPSDHRDIPKCYQALGKIHCEKGDYHQAHIDLNKALNFLLEFKSHSSRLAYLFNNIGEVYQNERNWPQALQSYEKALKLFRETFTDNDENIAWCYNNMGIIYEKQKNYQKAFDYLSKALRIKEEVLPPKHPCLGNTYNNLGNVHYQLKQYDQALENYQLCYETFEKSLKCRHPSIARVVRNIGIIYEMKNDLIQAKKNYAKALAIRKCTLSSSHPDMIEITEDIARISSKILGIDVHHQTTT